MEYIWVTLYTSYGLIPPNSGLTLHKLVEPHRIELCSSVLHTDVVTTSTKAPKFGRAFCQYSLRVACKILSSVRSYLTCNGCGRGIRTPVIWLMRPSWQPTPVHPALKLICPSGPAPDTFSTLSSLSLTRYSGS